MRIEIAGDSALIAYFSETPSPEVSQRIQQTQVALLALMGESIVDTVVSYASLLIVFNPLQTDFWAVKNALVQSFSHENTTASDAGRLVTLPVYYSEESGPDLSALALAAGLSVAEVIDIHQQQEYRVYAIGFAPGFAYLGEVDQRIAAARLATPRMKVPRGAVAIADRQTAVYPAVSPGGWNLIGLCPQRMFDPDKTPSMPVVAGDRVSFESITRDEFLRLGGEL
ncbi:KipI family sensor histidine kinase inhibitor [Sinobacterium caligoides]|uniref:KipI family sensor histidine kinase inhibitor n=1 Tax=Sinobacterium caligoides TaxID=933926 RepID=A0A3N2DYJ2_9GAMM|nr:5-oxoprolinase subunit PxpB [Sinobacterium caligoides]ROS04589.1 KipI family sensor histidine kinase inhibitor [Sinobacterium caligoides]